ncbi:MAG TPA: protein-L-isoaspartate(D-aspartate) O-methyltransferase [Candidatus Acidoferrales bacterium]|nr:protein-L-isoaspartate(D-aspartate) O-methyltransferase [Candidatus Acidoferrales bacterium]
MLSRGVDTSAGTIPDWESLRRLMLAEQIRKRGIRSPGVLAAMERVPRHLFVPEELMARSYNDEPVPIGERQTISQPYMVAAMTEALELHGHERVLEIGAGSGYQAAILGELACEVITIEARASLADAARERLARLGYSNVRVVTGDGTHGWGEGAPFDAILVAAAAPQVPGPLIEQLAEGGRMVIPVGKSDRQMLTRIRKSGGDIVQEELFLCQFVPLQGEHGWPAASAE